MSTFILRQRDLLTAVLMGFTAGYTTSNTKLRFNTFGGMMTGNTVKVGISLEAGKFDWAGVYLACISMFAIGTVFALFMIQRLGERAQSVFLLVFVAAFVLTDGLAKVLDHQDHQDGEEYNILASLASSLAAFALGAQNLLSQKSGVVKANTTFMTGNIQKMAEAVWNHFTKKGGLKESEKRAAVLLFCTWLPYIIGGVCGAALAHKGDWSLTPVSLLYAFGMRSMQVEGLPKGGGFLLCCEPPPATAELAPPKQTLPAVDAQPTPTPAVATTTATIEVVEAK